ncbi:DUF2726 domain-containing protein [Campylobacter helveticus]|uniref:DUF2726 domain-containing protein n=1 Tax=Campylobacter helveticus TaxID=28898 RepID=A0AAX2ULJ9_9BACT|nr:DUF2726 domain-containing protein [Campylobacter helveticus]TNB58770.1 DUF2726 domain-containing protein [Campylobacter helveticus]
MLVSLIFLCIFIIILALVLLKNNNQTHFTYQRKAKINNVSQEKQTKNTIYFLGEEICEELTAEQNKEIRKAQADFTTKEGYLQEFVKTKNLMWVGEGKIYWELAMSDFIKKNNIMVCPQVGMKAFLECKNGSQAYQAYSTLIVDYLLVNKNDYKPFCVIEFHGSGHYGKEKDIVTKCEVRKNDKLKEETLKKVKIPLQIITCDEVCQQNNRNIIDKNKLKDRIKELEKFLTQQLHHKL